MRCYPETPLPSCKFSQWKSGQSGKLFSLTTVDNSRQHLLLLPLVALSRSIYSVTQTQLVSHQVLQDILYGCELESGMILVFVNPMLGCLKFIWYLSGAYQSADDVDSLCASPM